MGHRKNKNSHDYASEFEETKTVHDNSTFSETQSRRLSSNTSAEPLTPMMEGFPPQDSKGNGLLLSIPFQSVAGSLCLSHLPGTLDPRTQSEWSLTRSKITESPYDYISTLPSKNIRDKFIDALNIWLEVSTDTLVSVKEVTAMLHNSSLILDDFQDGSPLRRGKPSTHSVFGPAQSINSATYVIVKAISKIQEFSNPECTNKAIDMIMTLFQGQAMDLHWTFNAICPSTQDYIQMVNDKTGGLFGLACYLIVANAPGSLDHDTITSLNKMVLLWGQYFQIRDDYMNIVDTEYSHLKGFCEDLDEGKYSLPLIHALESDTVGLVLPNLLTMRRAQGKLTYQQKMVVLDHIEACGGFEHTKMVLCGLHRQIIAELEKLEAKFRKDNTEIRALADRLRV